VNGQLDKNVAKNNHKNTRSHTYR